MVSGEVLGEVSGEVSGDAPGVALCGRGGSRPSKFKRRTIESSGRRLRTAATQWRVCADRATATCDPSCDALRGGKDSAFRFRWRMQLTHMRAGRGGQVGPSLERDACAVPLAGRDSVFPPGLGSAPLQVDGQDSSSVHAAIANRSLFVSIDSPRTACADDAWDALRARMQPSFGQQASDGREGQEAHEVHEVHESHESHESHEVHESHESHRSHRSCAPMRLATDEEAEALFALPASRDHRGGWEVRSA